MKRFLSVVFTVLCSLVGVCAVVVDKPFNDQKDLEKSVYNVNPEAPKIVDLPKGGKALQFTIPDDPKINPTNKIAIGVNGDQIRGRKVIIEADVKVPKMTATKKWGGGLFSLWFPYAKGHKGSGYQHCYIGTGDGGEIIPGGDGWKRLRKEFDVPEYAIGGSLSLGITNGRGTILFRNVKITADDYKLPLDSAMNFGFADQKAKDKKGGWHDEGPDADARFLPIKQKTFADIPFKIIDPTANNGKSIIVFANPRLPDGVKKVDMNLPAVSGKYLYLLQASAWGGQPKGSEIGYVDLEDKTGKRVRIPIVYGRDVIDWWGTKGATNAIKGAAIPSSNGSGAVYVSRYDIPKDLGPIVKASVLVSPDAKAWWMLVGATISDREAKQPDTQYYTVKESEEWKPFSQACGSNPLPGTALDMSRLFPLEKVGEHGRVIVNKDGCFAFEKEPEKAARFQGCSMARQDFNTGKDHISRLDKKAIENTVAGIRRNGYNMVLCWAGHFFAPKLNAFEVDPGKFDVMDYYIKCFRENGIYIFLSVSGAQHFRHKKWVWKDPRSDNMFTDPENLKAWKAGVKTFMDHVNPYTGLRYADDPVFMSVDCNNELEFVFSRADNSFATIWRDWLKHKYPNFDDLKKRWGDKAKKLNSFDDIKTFEPLQHNGSNYELDKLAFIQETEAKLLREERAYLREVGYKGPVASYRTFKSIRNLGVRKEGDFVAINTYHTHPSNGWKTVSHVPSSQGSNNVMRGLLATRIYGQPILISEHGHAFWNKYRYEQGIGMGAYAALNDVDGICTHYFTLTPRKPKPLGSFDAREDPIIHSSEFQTCLLYRREDVKPASFLCRIHVDVDQAIKDGTAAASPDSTQLKLGLVGRLSMDIGKTPVKKNERVIEGQSGKSVAVRSMDSSVVDAENQYFNLDKVLAEMKTNGWLAANNRSDASKGIFESATGEVLLEAKRCFMRVNSSRTQGVCALAGSKANMDDLTINSMSRNASVSVSAIDGDNAIRNANRLLLIISTDALNSGMVFDDSSMTTKIKEGGLPILLQTGKFDLSVKSDFAGKMKCWSLRADGTRDEEIPLASDNGAIRLNLDTSKLKSATVYFELTEK